MSAAHELLRTPGSALADQLRYGLRGLRAALAEALGDHPYDPGAAACAQYLTELDEQLASPREPAAWSAAGQPAGPMTGPTAGQPTGQPTGSAARQPTGTTTGSPARPTVGSGVAPAAEPRPTALLNLPFTPDWLRGVADDRPAVAQWQRLHLAALRMSELDANRWRSAVVEELGPEPDGAVSWHTLPGDVDTVLVPPLLGRPGWRTSPDAPADGDVLDRMRITDPRAGGPRVELARVASTVLAMAELDVDLFFGLESIRFMGLSRLDEATRAAFHRDLLDRLATYGATRYGTPESFAALLLVDEALHSVLHLPPPAPGSWWSRLADRSRALVYAAQGEHPGVQVQLLARQYREIKAMTGGNDIRFAHDGSGVVLGCLRLWARVGGVELPGRVVYAG